MSRESEITAVVAELEQLMATLRSNVRDLRAILTMTPEVDGDQHATA